jgi:hypothetical protein
VLCSCWPSEDGQLTGIPRVTVVVRSTPYVSARYGTRVARRRGHGGSTPATTAARFCGMDTSLHALLSIPVVARGRLLIGVLHWIAYCSSASASLIPGILNGLEPARSPPCAVGFLHACPELQFVGISMEVFWSCG